MTRRRELLRQIAGAGAGLLCAGSGVLAEDVAPPGPGAAAGSEKTPVRPGSVAPSDPTVREAYFYERIEEKRIRCLTCPHQCVLDSGETGICRAKRNLDGRHYSLSYGNPCSVNVDPIEKKPLFHFRPGTLAFSLAVAGCNFRCLNCQNWEISQRSPLETRNYELPPDQVVVYARHYGCESIAFTYSEPNTLYEYGVDTAVLAAEAGLRTVWVSNGYLAREPLDRLSRSIRGAAINLKSFEERIYHDLNGGSLKPVMDTLVRFKENGVWLEVINLVVPTYTDDLEMIRSMCKWFVTALGADTPLHFSRFHPMYKLAHLPPTPPETLWRARETALEIGLRHVYIGNVPGMAEDTICPGCGRKVVTRKGFRIASLDLKDGRCGFCGVAVSGVWS